jgi:hypothetical protein
MIKTQKKGKICLFKGQKYKKNDALKGIIKTGRIKRNKTGNFNTHNCVKITRSKKDSN